MKSVRKHLPPGRRAIAKSSLSSRVSLGTYGVRRNFLPSTRRKPRRLARLGWLPPGLQLRAPLGISPMPRTARARYLLFTMNSAHRTALAPAASAEASAPMEGSPTQPDLRDLPLHEEIAACARDLWRKYGCPMGRDEEIWLEAERQLLGVSSSVARVGGQPVAADALNQSAISGSSASPGGEGQVVRQESREKSEGPSSGDSRPASDARPGADRDASLAAAAGPVSRTPRRRAGGR